MFVLLELKSIITVLGVYAKSSGNSQYYTTNLKFQPYYTYIAYSIERNTLLAWYKSYIEHQKHILKCGPRADSDGIKTVTFTGCKQWVRAGVLTPSSSPSLENVSIIALRLGTNGLGTGMTVLGSALQGGLYNVKLLSVQGYHSIIISGKQAATFKSKMPSEGPVNTTHLPGCINTLHLDLYQNQLRKRK